MHNEKRAPVCLGYIGDEILPSYMEIIVIKPFQRIPINQPVFHEIQAGFLFVAQLKIFMASVFMPTDE